jgi:hypothetical protein
VHTSDHNSSLLLFQTEAIKCPSTGESINKFQTMGYTSAKEKNDLLGHEEIN